MAGKSNMSSLLSDWINAGYIGKEKNLNKKFLAAKPYPHLQFKDFLKKERAEELFKAISKENFSLKESDLFKLMQSHDFSTANNKVLREFRNFLASKEFIGFMEKITNEELKSNVIDCGGSVYTSTCFLLPHDDQLDGRSIAFIYYLSDLSKKDGGGLRLYGSRNNKPANIVKEMQPSFNSFSFFKVSKVSFHEVGEVLSDTPRISINGWFHDK